MPVPEPPAIAPRLLSRLQAAAYLGLTPRGFDRWRKDGRVPAPLPGTARWDKVAIDATIDALSGLSALQAKSAEPSPEADPFEKWRKRIADRRAERLAKKAKGSEPGR